MREWEIKKNLERERERVCRGRKVLLRALYRFSDYYCFVITYINVCLNVLHACCVKYVYNMCFTSIVHSLFLSLDCGTISQYCCTMYQYCCTVSVQLYCLTVFSTVVLLSSVLLYCCLSTVVLCYCLSTVVVSAPGETRSKHRSRMLRSCEPLAAWRHIGGVAWGGLWPVAADHVVLMSARRASMILSRQPSLSPSLPPRSRWIII